MLTNLKAPTLNRWWRIGGVVTAATIVVWCGWLTQSCMAGRHSALRFVAAVREGREPAAEGLVSPQLAEALRSDTNAARTLVLLRRTTGGLGVAQVGFTGNWRVVPFSCFDGELVDKRAFWIVMQKRENGWQVLDLRSDAEPRICHGEGE